MNTEFEEVFAALRDLMVRESTGAPVAIAVDNPGGLVIRTTAIDPKTKQPGWFGSVTIKKSYVAYHLMPLYTAPDLADDLSAALARRRQGKTCFNFKKLDEALLPDLERLTEQSIAAMRAGGSVGES